MNYRVIDMKGKRFNRLVGLEYVRTEKTGAYWLFKCDCGNKKIINGSTVRSGKVRSCGCFAKEAILERSTKHGMSRTRTYDIWIGIKMRCLNKQSQNYANYGGRGIDLCQEWISFEGFYEDMGDAPENMSIERIDNDKGYSKENCKWGTRQEQNLNKRYRNNTTGIRNISYSKKDDLYSVGISRNKKRYRKDFKKIEDAIEWRDNLLSKLDG